MCALASACGVVKPLGGDDESQSSGTSSSSSSGTSAQTTGVGCGTDPESGVNLCLGTTECPDVKLDTDTFPDCGLSTTTGSYDVECVCNGNQLCPVGVAMSCSDLGNLFTNKSLADFCNQDACKEVGPSTSTTSKPATRSANCDGSCADDCAGDTACTQACGC
ncbi:MAG TPA: hypothetical protein VHC69_33565 [Polyangiaceae bacterium]|nr:hypothetical protein [Polyangiaceae bacterium]